LIYIVEDDSNIRQMESYALRNSGYETVEFRDAESFFAECEKSTPTLVILDIMLPGDDGLCILKKMRENAQTRVVPVIMVTAKSSELDAVRGLDMGADDYITKPFGIMEFISRVKAVMRRINTEVITRYTYGNIVLDDEKHHVTSSGTLCDLTFKEYELLKLLLINQGIVLTRDKIMDRVWDTDFEGESRTVDVHINTLRQKLVGNSDCIKTVRNVGYKLE